MQFATVRPRQATSSIIAIDAGTLIEKKIGFNLLKTFTNSSATAYKFGELTQIFELLYYTSPSRYASHNYSTVRLLQEFSNFLQGIFTDYNMAEGLFIDFREILNLRNCAGHTYSDSVCTSDTVDKRTAATYASKVEAIFKCL